jgi:ABC-type multidrug transport system fused ATPase/permease subunit
MDKRSPFSRAWGFLGFRPRPKWLVFTAAAVVALCDGALVVVPGLCVELLAAGPPATAVGLLDRLGLADGPSAAWSGLFGLSLALLLIREAGFLVLRLAAGRAVADAGTRLRRAVYHHTFRAASPLLTDEGTGGGAEAVDCVETVANGLHSILGNAIPALLRGGVLALLALVVDYRLTLTTLAAALALLAAGRPAAAWYEGRAAAARDKAARFLVRFGETFSRARLVRAYRMETYQQCRAEDDLAARAAAETAVNRRRAAGRFLLAMVVGPAVLGVSYFAGLLVLGGGLGLGASVVWGASLLALSCVAVELQTGRVRYRRTSDAAAVVFDFLDRPGSAAPTTGTEPLPRLTRHVEFDGVTLTGPDGVRLFHEVTLGLPAGRRYALIGADDRTKQAFVALLLRFVDPSAGEVRFDQHNLRAVTLDSLRGQIGLVPQHGLLFTATVADNLRCGDEQFDLPALVAAAKLTHAHHFVQKLPRGYETTIGPLGQSLSVGEAFRLALARAILRDPAVLIVAEPPAGALDADAEALLPDTLSRVARGRTTVVLPHHEATLRACDEVLLLHGGRMEARGTHAELLAGNELYQHLFYREFNPFAGRL